MGGVEGEGDYWKKASRRGRGCQGCGVACHWRVSLGMLYLSWYLGPGKQLREPHGYWMLNYGLIFLLSDSQQTAGWQFNFYFILYLFTLSQKWLLVDREPLVPCFLLGRRDWRSWLQTLFFGISELYNGQCQQRLDKNKASQPTDKLSIILANGVVLSSQSSPNEL